MTKTKKLAIITICVLSLLSFSGCENNASTIPAVNETTIEETADSLGLSTDLLNQYLESLGITYDKFISNLNENNIDISTLKSSVEEKYNCTYDEYIRTIITVNNNEIPDSSEFDVLLSKYSLYDAYFPKGVLSDDKTTLLNGTVKIEVADNSADAYAFDIISKCNNDFSVYLSTLNSKYGCLSVEFNNMTLLGGIGVTKPEEENACMDNIFVYDKTTNEVLERFVSPVLTMHFEDKSKDTTLLLSNELGLIFKTEGEDSLEKMKAIMNVEFQIRDANLSDNKTTTTNGKEE